MKQKTAKNQAPASSSSTLQVLNDLYLVEEDEMALDATGEVYDAIKAGTLHIPDAYKAFYEKVPYTGTVVAKGDKVKYDVPIGAKVMYGKFSCQRFTHNGKRLLIVKEKDLHGIIG
ncbi:MAG TPA: hypothetical protein VJ742_10030 [Nitrososphaera sp.]|nr:hypothetical protein [Nitrososphaera sp.]